MSEWKEEWRRFRKSGQEMLAESTLNRVMGHIENHDSAVISAFRNEYSKKENYERSRILRAQLIQGYGYQITKIKGSYIEGFVPQEEADKLKNMDPDSHEYRDLKSRVESQQEVTEQSLFVLNSLDDPNFFDNVRALAEEFEQDSVMLVPRGGDHIQLYGTRLDNEYPAYHESQEIGSIVLNKSGQFMSKVGGTRPFVVEAVQLMSKHTFSRLQLMAMDALIRENAKTRSQVVCDACGNKKDETHVIQTKNNSASSVCDECVEAGY